MVFILLSGFVVRAQQIGIQAINTAGNYSQNGPVQLESSVGGLAVATLGLGNLRLTQDFLQPFAGIASTVPDPSAPILSSAGPDNAGTTFVSANAMIEFTVGEFASLTLNGSGYMLTQGILQPFGNEPALPVTLVDFQAKRSENDWVLVTWATVGEVNNQGFIVERRLSHETGFSETGFVDAATPGGHHKGLLDYTFRDYNPHGSISYYRLKQVDIDGRFSYSVIRSVEGLRSAAVSLKAWPVPAPDGRIWVEIPGTDPDVLLVFSADGRLIRQSPIKNGIPVSLLLPAPGVYILRLAGQPSVSARIVVR